MDLFALTLLDSISLSESELLTILALFLPTVFNFDEGEDSVVWHLHFWQQMGGGLSAKNIYIKVYFLATS